MSKKDKKQKLTSLSNGSKKQKEHINIRSIDFPYHLEGLSAKDLSVISRKVFESYRIFDYKNMSEINLEKKEWHTWQISVLLMLYKKNEEFFIPLKEGIFNDSLLNLNEKSMKNLMDDILNKYKNHVDITLGKDKLCKEYIWSNREVSIIFYFLTTYKTFK